MILIVSDSQDQSTCDVLDWLYYLNKEFVLLTDTTCYDIISTDLLSFFIIKIQDKIIDSRNLESIWYRRGTLIPQQINLNKYKEESDISVAFCKIMNKEIATWHEFIQTFLNNIKSINNQQYSTINKLIALQKADQLGIKTPPSILTTRKSVLQTFKNKHKSIITKPACDGYFYPTENWIISVYTEVVDEEFMSQISESFAPSFFQKMIDKKFEIRTFYLDHKFYSMAIFSQTNQKTKIDYRHYDNRMPNRNIPFKLPNTIEERLDLLMSTLHLSSGSIDMIYSIDRQYYFLEVNPIGQFGMTSYPCNYHIEKLIAEYL